MANILIVDDDAMDREMAARSLRHLPDLSVEYCDDGLAALEQIANSRPDLVLTDLRMPAMDGLKLVETLQQEYSSLPVVLMTSMGSEEVAVQALEAGAIGYVPKRVMQEELSDAIRKGLEVAQAIKHRKLALGRLKSSETVFELENDPSLVAPVVGYFQDHLRSLGFGNELIRNKIGIALMEALSNGMIHGNLEISSSLRRERRDRFDELVLRRQSELPYSDRRVRCHALESAQLVTYVVEDEGPGFDPATLPDPRMSDNLLRVSGRGIMLMRTFMDEVKFNPKGNIVTLIREISA